MAWQNKNILLISAMLCLVGSCPVLKAQDIPTFSPIQTKIPGEMSRVPLFLFSKEKSAPLVANYPSHIKMDAAYGVKLQNYAGDAACFRFEVKDKESKVPRWFTLSRRLDYESRWNKARGVRIVLAAATNASWFLTLNLQTSKGDFKASLEPLVFDGMLHERLIDFKKLKTDASAAFDVREVTNFKFGGSVLESDLYLAEVSFYGEFPGEKKIKTPVVSGETSNPKINVFVVGEPIGLVFFVSGMEPGQSDTLHLKTTDEFDFPLSEAKIPVTADATGKCLVRTDGFTNRMGFVRVYAGLSSGARLEAKGSRPAGSLTYAIVPDPALRPALKWEDRFFGIMGGYSKSTELTLLLLGVRWKNGGLTWKNAEPERPGQFTETFAGKKAQYLKAGKDYPPSATEIMSAPYAGKSVSWKMSRYLSLYHPPEWAVVPGTSVGLTGVLTPYGETAWAAYCSNIGAAYALQYPEDEKRIYQITWEPNDGWGFKGTERDLVRIHQIAYLALHDADPKALVSGPTLTGLSEVESSIRKHKKLIEAGLLKSIDILDCHPYMNEHLERDGFIRVIREIRRLLADAGGREIPMIGTESGLLDMPHNTDGYLRQARHNIRQELIMLGEGFRMGHSFYITDHGAAGVNRGYFYCLDEPIVYGPEKISPHPAAAAFAAMTYLLEGTRSAGAVEWLGESVIAYAYEKPGNTILAVWNIDGQKRRVQIPAGVRRLEISDWMGNKRPLELPDGFVNIEVGPEPVYLIGVSSNLWGSSAPKIVKVVAPETAFPGETIRVEVTCVSVEDIADALFSVARNDSLGIAATTTNVSLKKGTAVRWTVPGSVPVGTRPGDYAVSALVSARTAVLGGSGMRVRVREPFAISRIRPWSSSTGNAVAVTVQEKQGKTFSGTVSLAYDEASLPAKSVPLTLERNEEKVFLLPFDFPSPLNAWTGSATNRVSAKVALRSAQTYAVENSAVINFFQAPRFRERSWFDADLSEAGGKFSVAIGKENAVDGLNHYSGADDCRATFGFWWDDSHLYFAGDVVDDEFLQGRTGSTTWMDDSVQLAVNLDPEKAGKAGTVETLGLMRYTEMTMALTSNGAEAFRTKSFDQRFKPNGLLGASDIAVVITAKGGRIQYRARIPWTTLGLEKAPSSHDVIGVAVLVNDRDRNEQGTRAQLELFGGIAGGKSPEKFGLLHLNEK